MSPRTTLTISSAIVLVICAIVTAALILSARIFTEAQEEVTHSHNDLLAPTKVEVTTSEYMQHALPLLHGAGPAEDLPPAESEVDEAFAELEATQREIE